jgi:hypothetical protein
MKGKTGRVIALDCLGVSSLIFFFSTIHTLIYHFRPRCSRVLRSDAKMSQQNQRVDCPLCRKRFKNRHTLFSHTTDIHDDSAGHPIPCPVPTCNKTYQSRSKFTLHLSNHSVSNTTRPLRQHTGQGQAPRCM